MTHDRAGWRGADAPGKAIPRLMPFVLSGLLILSLLTISGGSASASLLRAAPAGRNRQAAGTTLAMVSTGGASLYDDSGKLLLDLPGGETLKVSGRTSDSRWFYGATKDGATGWVNAAGLVIFGVNNVPVREGFTEPKPIADAATATTAAELAMHPDAPAVLRLQAVVNSGTQRLNVRAGPGAAYSVVGSLVSGTQLVASARDAAADWIRVEGANLSVRSGWASARYLTLDGKALDLPVAAPASPPVSAPAALPARPSSAATGLAGKLVFQERSGGKIYVYDLASASLRQLTTGADPAISPDGRTVVFWRDTGEKGLYLIGIDAADERRILTRGEQMRAPAWSPDGQKIAFSHVIGQESCRYVGYNVCYPDEFPYNYALPVLVTMDRWGLARVDRGGGSYQDLAALPNAFSPSWTSRGIFYASAGVYDGRGAIHGGAGIQVTQDAIGENQNRPVASAYRYQDPSGQLNGDQLVFQSLEKDHWEIFIVNADGSGLVALTRPDPLASPLPHNVSPAWSPDGRHIVFLSNRTGQWRLWVMNADGSNQRPLPLDVPIEYDYQAEQVVSWGQ